MGDDVWNWDNITIAGGMLTRKEASVFVKAAQGHDLFIPDKRDLDNNHPDRQSPFLVKYLCDLLHGDKSRCYCGFDGGSTIYCFTILIVNHTENPLYLDAPIKPKYGDLTGEPANHAIPAAREKCPGLGAISIHKQPHGLFDGETYHGLDFSFAFKQTPSLPTGMSFAGTVPYKSDKTPAIQVIAEVNSKKALDEVNDRSNGAGHLITREVTTTVMAQPIKSRIDASLQNPERQRSYVAVVSVGLEIPPAA